MHLQLLNMSASCCRLMPAATTTRASKPALRAAAENYVGWKRNAHKPQTFDKCLRICPIAVEGKLRRGQALQHEQLRQQRR